jgi:hypothetical protein
MVTYSTVSLLIPLPYVKQYIIEFTAFHGVYTTRNTKKVFQISIWRDALSLQCEPLPY